MQAIKSKIKRLQRCIHTSNAARSSAEAQQQPETEAFHFPDDILLAKRKRGPTKFDWMRINEMDLHDLPAEPDEAQFKAENDWWKNLESGDFFPPETEAKFDDDGDRDIDESELPYAQLTDTPLPTTPYPSNLSPEQAKLRKQRLMENFELFRKVPKPTVILSGFLEMRREGFIPHREYYCLLIPCLVAFADHQAIEIVLKEMEQLGYEKDEFVYSALITQAIIFDNPTLVEQRWKEMIDQKYEPSAQICAQRLFYYIRYSEDTEKAKNCFYEALDLGHRDPLLGTVILTLCREKQLFPLAEEVMAKLTEKKMIKAKFDSDVEHFEVEGLKYDHNPTAASCVSLYECMADITARQGFVERTEQYLKNAKAIYDKYVKKQNDDPYFTNLLSMEQVIYMYFKAKQFQKGLDMISGVEKSGYRFAFDFYKNVMINLTIQDNSHFFREFQIEFENWGFNYDGDIYSAMMRMFFRLKDYRKVKNTWDEMVMAGCKPTIDCYTILLTVFSRVGLPDDVQRFYESQMRTGLNFERGFHEVMFEDFLKRGFPKSAHQVAVTKMKADGFDLTREQFVSLIEKYAQMGGGSQALSIFENDFLKAGFNVDADVLASVIFGFTVNPSAENAEQARKLWKKYSSQIVLTYSSAEKLIRCFGGLREPNVALQIYNRIRKDYTFTESDGSSIFEAILSAPKTTQCSLEERLKVLEHMRSYNIVIFLEVYLAALKLCEEYASAKYALRVIKDFIIDYKGIPYHRGLFIDFFTALVRFDSSEYRGLGMIWLKRIVPKEHHATFMNSLRSPHTYTLDEIRNSFMSLTQSSAIREFIDTIPEDKLTPVSTEEDYSELFEGSEIDIEDLLVAKYGEKERENIQKAVGVDSDYLSTKAKLEQLSAERKAAYAEYNKGRVDPLNEFYDNVFKEKTEEALHKLEKAQKKNKSEDGNDQDADKLNRE